MRASADQRTPNVLPLSRERRSPTCRISSDRSPRSSAAAAVRPLPNNSAYFIGKIMAERVGFEPTCRLPDKPLSRRSRYDHFGTSPQRKSWRAEHSILLQV